MIHRILLTVCTNSLKWVKQEVTVEEPLVLLNKEADRFLLHAPPDLYNSNVWFFLEIVVKYMFTRINSHFSALLTELYFNNIDH